MRLALFLVGFFVRQIKAARFRSPRGTRLLVFFLVVTLGLSVWMGYQALDAARSHRRTVDGVLTQYAGLAILEFTKRIEENIGDIQRWTFDDIPWSLDRRRPNPIVMENDFHDVIRRQRCRCATLRETAWFFRADLRDTVVVTAPDTIPTAEKLHLAREISRHRESNRRSSDGLITLAADSIFSTPRVAIYFVSGSRRSGEAMAYGVVADASGFQDLISGWLSEGPLLPTMATPPQRNDSLLQVSVIGPGEVTLFRSPGLFPGEFPSKDTLNADFGSLVVGASIREEAAGSLIIGGLPRQRVPLLLALIALTLGVGSAALFQIRREHQLARMRDDFVSSVSHEFRTPLTQIQVFADLLDSGRLETDEKRRWSTGVIKREARRLSHLVANILHFSPSRRAPISSGAVEEIHLSSALEETTEAFLPLAEARTAKIRVQSDPEQHVLANRSDLHRIFANLLDNALKYGPVGQAVEVEATSADGVVRISVEDEGPGIAPEERERVFDPYFRLEQDSNGTVQGSGIGLALVAELSSILKGRVWVEEGERGGARFVVELPKAPDRASASSPVSVEEG